MTQAVHHPDRHRTQIYVDDPITAVRGTGPERTWLIARTLLLWGATGARVALPKAHRGPAVPWIGARYGVVAGGVQISVDADRIRKLSTKVEEALASRGMAHGIRSLTGELSWVAGIVPTTRSFAQMLWAAVHSSQRQGQAVRAGTSRARARPDDLIFVRAIKEPLQWFQRFLAGRHGGLQRTRLLVDRSAPPQWAVRTDASTTGAGGILFSADGVPRRWWSTTFAAAWLGPMHLTPGTPGP